MQQNTKLLVVACTLSGCSLLGQMQTGIGTSAPSGTAPTVASSSDGAAPATGGGFCGAKHYGRRTAKELHAWFDDADKGRHELHFLIKIHQALCSPDTASSDRGEIASMRKTVLAELGLAEADTADMPKLLDLDMTDTAPGYFEHGELPSAKGVAKASTGLPIDQLYVLHDTGNWFYKTRWLVDAWGDTLTESARAAYISRCIHDLDHAEPTTQALGYVWCSDDAHRLDRAKLARELSPLPPDVRFAAKLEVARLALRVAKLEREIAKQPQLAKVAIDMPRRIADSWRTFAGAHKPTVDHVRAIELAWLDNNGKAPDDCRARLASDWKQAIAAVKVDKANAPSLGVASTSRQAYLASVGMARCTAKLPGYAGLSHMVGESLDRAPLGRGPRTEAFEAAIAELQKGTTDKVDVPRMEAVDVSFLPMTQSNGHSARFWAHTVAKTERVGDLIRFQFKKEKVDYAVCTREEPTGRWIFHGNVLERETHCVAVRAESTMEAVDPVELPADLTSWVRPGNAIVIGDSNFPIEIWSDVHQTRLLGLYGTNRG